MARSWSLVAALLALLAVVALCAAPVAAAKDGDVDATTSECAACHFVVGYIDGALGNNKTVENILKVLDEVCTVLPKSFQADCTSLLINYFDELVQIILKDENPDTACNQLGLCDSAQEGFRQLEIAYKNYVFSQLHPAEFVASQPPASSSFCTTCKFVVSYADIQLKSNATQEEVIDFVDTVCSVLPTTIKDACDAFIAKYGPELMDKLAADLNSDTICEEIGACSTSAKIAKPVAAMSECSICEYIVAAAETIITNNSTESDIEKYLDDVCAILGSFKSICTGFVSQYLPVIFSDLVNGESPSAVCSDIKVCTSSLSRHGAKPSAHVGKH